MNSRLNSLINWVIDLLIVWLIELRRWKDKMMIGEDEDDQNINEFRERSNFVFVYFGFVYFDIF